ncbi:Uncharacterised protein [Mycobacteroides abscessus]|nr:Uncharacterised protein [Mycobacteroides abscessus]
MPSTASHDPTDALVRNPRRSATPTTSVTETRLATSEVSTCAHRTLDRATGIDRKRSTMPPWRSRNSR